MNWKERQRRDEKVEERQRRIRALIVGQLTPSREYIIDKLRLGQAIKTAGR